MKGCRTGAGCRTALQEPARGHVWKAAAQSGGMSWLGLTAGRPPRVRWCGARSVWHLLGVRRSGRASAGRHRGAPRGGAVRVSIRLVCDQNISVLERASAGTLPPHAAWARLGYRWPVRWRSAGLTCIRIRTARLCRKWGLIRLCVDRPCGFWKVGACWVRAESARVRLVAGRLADGG